MRGTVTYPELPFFVETESIGPDTYHSPTIQHDGKNGNDVEHEFGAELKMLLTPPKCEYTDALDDIL